MARYFFHTYDGKDTFDAAGTECGSVRAVRLHMLAIATQEVSTADPQKEIWSIEAMDDQGKVVGSMDFGLLSTTDYRR